MDRSTGTYLPTYLPNPTSLPVLTHSPSEPPPLHRGMEWKGFQAHQFQEYASGDFVLKQKEKVEFLLFGFEELFPHFVGLHFEDVNLS